VKRLAIILLLLASSLATAGDKVAYQDWVVDMSPGTNEAYTIADPNSSFGAFCASEKCLFYLHQSFNCTPGAKYPVLMNSLTISKSLTMECTLIGGNLFQILTPFETVLRASQVGDTIGFAVALQSGAFAVTRFSLVGAKPAIDRALIEAAKSKSKEQKPRIDNAPKTKSKDVSI
jgi:hypothetical protein